jgi:sulfotransferase family protein
MIRRFPSTRRQQSVLPLTYVQSLVAGVRNRKVFHQVELYCMFIGYQRSGHSLVGALLDAHPEVVMAHELDSLGFIRSGFRRSQIYALILANSRSFAAEGRAWTGYDYVVPGGAQGTFDRLRVIGDKRGGSTITRLQRHPEHLAKLVRVIGDPIRFVHVIRNPYDNITTMAARSQVRLEDAIRNYFRMCRTIQWVKDQIPAGTVMDLQHEDLIRNPKTTIKKLCGFLGLSARDDYLERCASIVFGAPHRTRSEAPWTSELRSWVEREMSNYPFLGRYTWDS